MGQVGQNLYWRTREASAREAQPPVTQEELSKKLARLGVSIDRAGVAKIETGIRAFSTSSCRFAKALVFKVTWLLGVKGRGMAAFYRATLADFLAHSPDEISRRASAFLSTQ